jgi:hypothetical protein
MSVDLVTRPPSAVRTRERRLVALACGLVYLSAALWFWHQDLVPGDSASRVANAYYTLFSRDPHLAAIGFVWNPLPSLILLPFLPLGLLFPALVQEGMLVVLVSAALMTATVTVAHDVLRRSDVPRTARLALTGAFALHPMIVIYSGNGMSEAGFLLCLMLAVRALQIWLAEGRAESLVPLGLAIGLAYGARYEALAPVAAVPVLVFLTTFWRTPGDRARRTALARTDAVIAGLPGLLAVILWALAGKLIVGQWFATFSSEYGNSAQVGANAAGIGSVTGDDLPERFGYWLQQMAGLAPLFVVVLVAALALAWHRRDPRVLAPFTVLGSVLAFDGLAFLSGTSFGWLRFHITVIPLTVLLAGHLIAALPGPARSSPAPAGALPGPLPGPAGSAHTLPGSAGSVGSQAGSVGSQAGSQPDSVGSQAGSARPSSWPGASRFGAPWWDRSRVPVTGAMAVIILVLAAIPSTLVTLNRPTLAREESEWLTADGAARTRGLTLVNRQVAADLDAMALPEGAVLTDAAYAFGIVLASDHPKQFVITPDRDFAAVLGDPAANGVRYLLLSARGAADAVRIERFGPEPTAVPTTGARIWRDPAGNPQWTLVAV